MFEKCNHKWTYNGDAGYTCDLCGEVRSLNEIPPTPIEDPFKKPLDKDEIIRDFAHVVNRHCIENGSNTPDFLIAEYLYDCLLAYNATIVKRNKWYNNTAENHVINPMEP